MLKKLFLLVLLLPLGLLAQKTIAWKGMQLNALDKQGRKQGEWLFFDSTGTVRMQCAFHNDQPTGPRVFYNSAGDTTLLRFSPEDSSEHFIYYYHGQPISGLFSWVNDKFRIELDRLPEGFSDGDLKDLKTCYTTKIDPLYMFGRARLQEYFSAAYYKSNTIPNWNHNFVLTINASGKVTNVEWADKEDIPANERELFDIFYSMGRWQPFFDTWDAKEIKLTMSLGADLQPITAR
ncbi:hypothetical protein [Flavihumibacter petaseus]|uniref:Uncharacterized protein n=1 Tax=Flavihumibacter petaseus NBRC 106054 TaxID=1220578 RepID=A0A0E9N5H5_9BACT|nr:hypothetical protein [Flavihumibacter petaseus]GAO45069.1 hypothetical protein FPE01S_04_03120 [Flavihumibacter petaseus NBRC 106054]